MNNHIVEDLLGEPYVLVLNYKEWLAIAKKHNIPPIVAKRSRTENPFDRYGITELANSVLNGVIAYCTREEFKEIKKKFPDASRLTEIRKLQNEVLKINADPSNFKSIDKMKGMIEKYAPIISAETTTKIKR